MTGQTDNEFNEILEDNISGSTKVLEKLLIHLEQSVLRLDTDEWQKVIRNKITQLSSHRAELVILKSFGDSLVRQLSSDKSTLLKWLSNYRDRWNYVPTMLANRLKDSLQLHGATVLLHSHSQTVINTIMKVVEQGKQPDIIQTESRPMLEGREQARVLAESGLKVKLIIDIDIGRYISQADLIIMGADQYDEVSFVNKTGSQVFSDLAVLYNKPLVVLTDIRKEVTETMLPNLAPENEIWSDRDPKISMDNQYFERVELKDHIRLMAVDPPTSR